MPSLRTRGFLLVVALFMLSICLVMGMGLLGSQEARYRGSRRVLEAAQAMELARAGLEDARIKLERDLEFPNPAASPQSADPQDGDEQLVFTYGEDLETPEGLKGSYFVTIDRTLNRAPYRTLQVTSVGTLGPKESPLAQRRLRCEYFRPMQLDAENRPLVDANGVPLPPLPYRQIRFEDFGSL